MAGLVPAICFMIGLIVTMRRRVPAALNYYDAPQRIPAARRLRIGILFQRIFFTTDSKNAHFSDII